LKKNKEGKLARVVFYRPDDVIDSNLNGRDRWDIIDLRANQTYLSKLPPVGPGEQ
jgi:hypothetical protein